jgi:predicted phage-related endonuclease
MGATVDRLQWAHLDGWGVLELKSRNTWAGGEWDSNVPDDVLLQLHHQMLCTGTAWGSVACLIGGNKFVWEDIQRNDAVCQKLVEKAREFNKRLQTGEAPPIDGSESTGHTLRLLHPDDNGNAVHLDASIRVWDELYVTSCEQEKAAQASKREAQNHLIAAIGDNTFGVGENFEWSYKTQERSISLKVEPEHEVALIKARIPYDITGGTKSRVLRRKSK